MNELCFFWRAACMRAAEEDPCDLCDPIAKNARDLLALAALSVLYPTLDSGAMELGDSDVVDELWLVSLLMGAFRTNRSRGDE